MTSGNRCADGVRKAHLTGHDRSFSIASPSMASGASEVSGELWTWGFSDDGVAREPQRILQSGVIQVSCGLFHATAVTSDGLLYTWGRGEGGRLGGMLDEMNRNRGGIMPLFCPAPTHPVDVASACPPDHELDAFVVAASAGVRICDTVCLCLFVGLSVAPLICAGVRFQTFKTFAGGLHTLALTRDGQALSFAFKNVYLCVSE